MTAPILTLSQVSKTYEGADAPVLRGIALEIEEGQSVAIVGPSGCGKSTLLNCIGGLDRPSAGTIRFKGEDIAQRTPDAMAAYRSAEAGFVFQQHHLLPQCTVLENVLVPSLIHPDRDQAQARAVALLERAGLGALQHARPARLSGGERQRAAVVRALINRPSLLLADEPTGSLSESGADALTDLLLDLNREENLTLIVVTHSMRVARRMERVYALHEGVLTEERAQ